MTLSLLLLIPFAIAMVGTLLWIKLSNFYHWFDVPTNRSSHSTPTPTSGGIAIVLAYFTFVLLIGTNNQAIDWSMLSGALLLALVGLVDDFRNLGIRLRLSLQVVAVVMLLPILSLLPPLQIGNFYFHSMFMLTFFFAIALLWFVNLFNFMDGIDGLASTQALYLVVAIEGLSLLNGNSINDPSLLVLGAGTCGFLVWNFPKGRVFLGDIGSYFLGFTIAVLGFKKVVNGELSLWALAILPGTFVVDSSTTLLGRLRSEAVWYHPHRTHAYQLLAQRWSSHGRVLVVNLAVNLLWLLPLACWAQMSPSLGVWALLLAWLPLSLGVWLIRLRLTAV